MTDDEVIAALATREGWSWTGRDWKKQLGPDKDGWESVIFAEAMPYLTSRDALAPVLEKLTLTEKSRLDNALGWLFWDNKDVYNQNVWPLTLPPSTLAHLIAEAIKEGG